MAQKLQSVVNKLQNISGILGVLAAVGTIASSYLIAPEALRQVDPALSNFGVTSKTALLFNIGMVLAAVLGTTFIVGLLRQLDMKLLSIPGVMFVLAFGGLMGLGLVPYDIDRSLHWNAAQVFLFMLPLAQIVLGISIYKKWQKLSVFCLGCGILVYLVGIPLWLQTSNFLLVEIWAVLMATFWILVTNIYITRVVK